MTPVVQEFLVDSEEKGVRGDCVRATIASILDLPLSEVPHFVQIDHDGGQNFWDHMNAWLHTRGFALFGLIPGDSKHGPRPGEFYYVVGVSPRGGYLAPGIIRRLHAVVYRDEQLAHDPHPDGTGVCEVVERWAIRSVPILR